MLPARSRLRDRTLLTTTVRRGNRAGRRLLVVHYLPAPKDSDASARVAFAVSAAVGGSVVRHRVIRRLRHIVATQLTELPAGSTMVVRALPASARATSADLERDLAALVPRVVG